MGSSPPATDHANDANHASDAAFAAVLRAEADAAGFVSFERFMELALYHPSHGYYERHLKQTGRDGDFFTSVDVGPVFGSLLARQFADMWRTIRDPRSAIRGPLTAIGVAWQR